MARSRRSPLYPLFLVGFTAVLLPIPALTQERSYPGPDDTRLEIQDDSDILLALTDGEIIESETLGTGTTGVRRLVIEHNGIRVRAVFRDVDESERNLRLRDGSVFARFYDSYAAECAAYELDRMLGMEMIPPAVLRYVDGQRGSVQLWIEGAMTEGDRASSDARPDDFARWRSQQSIMRVFDALVHNSDRNTGNSLIDGDWNLWLIDHSRAFQIPRGDSDYSNITQMPAWLWDAIVALDEDTVRERLNEYLEPAQLTALFQRRDELAEHVAALTAERGVGAVLLQ